MKEIIEMQLKILKTMKINESRLTSILSNYEDKPLYDKLIEYENEIINSEMLHVEHLIKLRYAV